MKKIIFILAAAVLFATSCSSEPIEEIEQIEGIYSELNFRVEASNTRAASREPIGDTPCSSTPLIAGQHIDAGVVTFDVYEDEIIITYESSSDWDISAVHLSLSDCDDLSFPVTRSGSPKIGEFEYASEYEDVINRVSYYFKRDELSDKFCVAAHAVVENANGDQETAWAEGLDFDGRSWAMYASVDLSDCSNDEVHPDE
jgi:hypothetical protein